MSKMQGQNIGSQTIGVTAAFTGALGATTVASFELNKVGNMVFLGALDSSLFVSNEAPAGATSVIFAESVIPEGFRPQGATFTVFMATIVSASTPTTGVFGIREDGGLVVQVDFTGTDFGTTGDNGFLTPAAYWRA